MSELRHNLLTQDWILFAPERSRRGELRPHVARPRPAAHVADCPFCPGNEERSAGAVLEMAGDGGWTLRVVPNKFPALEPSGGTAGPGSEPFPRRPAFGYHEVLVESHRHDDVLALMDDDGVARVLAAYRSRYQALRADPRVHHVVVFKNHGADAGCSQEHPHSQIVAMSVVPPEVRHRLAIVEDYRARHGECLSCHLLAEEVAAAERVVLADEHFVAYVPFAAYSPFHTWIVPRAHQASFGDLSDEALAALARTLRALLHKVHVALGDPDYNLVLRSAPGDARAAASWHWYASLVPRVSKQAGFELGSGMFINTMLPESAARLLRDAPLSGDQ